MVTVLAAFAVAAMLIVLLPGPDTLVVVRNLVRGGHRAAVLAVLGVLTGLAVWVVAAAFGLSGMLRASAEGYAALRIVGAVYLVWLGVQSLRARRMEASSAGSVAHRGLLGSGFRAGLATDLLNPKVGVFFVTFLPGFVPHGHAVGTTSLLLGSVFIAETAAYFAVLLLLADRVTAWMNSPRTRRRLDRGTGLVLIAFGMRLAVES